MTDGAGLADDRRGPGILAGARHHHHEIGGGNLLDQIFGAAGEVIEPTAERETLRRTAGSRAGEGRSGEKGCALPGVARQLLHYAFARGIERDDFDRARLRIRRFDAKLRLRRRTHAGRLALHSLASRGAWSATIAKPARYFIIGALLYNDPPSLL